MTLSILFILNSMTSVLHAWMSERKDHLHKTLNTQHLLHYQQLPLKQCSHSGLQQQSSHSISMTDFRCVHFSILFYLFFFPLNPSPAVHCIYDFELY